MQVTRFPDSETPRKGDLARIAAQGVVINHIKSAAVAASIFKIRNIINKPIKIANNKDP